MKPDKENVESGVDDGSTQVNQATAPDFRFIPVTLTFDGYPPFKFEFKRQQSKDVKEARQAFYALTEDEQTAQLKSYRINVLSSIITGTPVGVQGYPENDDFRAAFSEYFTDPDNEELLQWIWSQYQEKLYPKELLSSPLE
jgi:hypothetical protein